MRSALIGLAATWALLMCLAIYLPVSSGAEPPDGLPLRDEFDEEFTLDWKTVRPDPTHLSLQTHPGKLTITTQYGSIWEAQTTAKNLFLIDIPKGLDEFVVTTKIVNFLPETQWQQAGILLYKDDDNYLKWVRDCNQGRPDLNACLEAGGTGRGFSSPIELSKKRFWLRLIKRGDLYQFAASPDGETFTTYAVRPWENGGPTRVGLVAKNGPREGDMEAQFEFFELRRLTDAERDDPVFRLRRELLGKWQSVKATIDGKMSSQGKVTVVVIEPGNFSLREKTSLAMSYTVDLSTTPNRITLIPRNHGVGKLINGVFSLDGDTFTLCLNPKLNGPAPDALESVEGTGHMAVKLKRVEERE